MAGRHAQAAIGPPALRYGPTWAHALPARHRPASAPLRADLGPCPACPPSARQRSATGRPGPMPCLPAIGPPALRYGPTWAHALPARHRPASAPLRADLGPCPACPPSARQRSATGRPGPMPCLPAIGPPALRYGPTWAHALPARPSSRQRSATGRPGPMPCLPAIGPPALRYGPTWAHALPARHRPASAPLRADLGPCPACPPSARQRSATGRPGPMPCLPGHRAASAPLRADLGPCPACPPSARQRSATGRPGPMPCLPAIGPPALRYGPTWAHALPARHRPASAPLRADLGPCPACPPSARQLRTNENGPAWGPPQYLRISACGPIERRYSSASVQRRSGSE
jgi:hypothetical protein